MSADIYVTVPACPTCDRPEESVGDFNLTYNLIPMLWAAGMPRWAEFVGMNAADAGLMWEAVVDELKSKPDLYKTLNPENGWGNYEGAVNTLTELAACCAAYPSARIEAWL